MCICGFDREWKSEGERKVEKRKRDRDRQTDRDKYVEEKIQDREK